MIADMKQLHKVLLARITAYRQQNGREPSTPSIAQLLSNTLYYRRFFPYYTFNVLAGLDDEGKGWCYSYDAVGSYERVQCAASGSGSALALPVLDSQVRKD
jgi:20S proteasome subunit beta 6